MARVGHPWRTHNAKTIRKELAEYRAAKEAREKREAEPILIELLDRIGSERYENWIDVMVSDSDTWPEIQSKAVQVLETRDWLDAHKDERPD